MCVWCGMGTEGIRRPSPSTPPRRCRPPSVPLQMLTRAPSPAPACEALHRVRSQVALAAQATRGQDGSNWHSLGDTDLRVPAIDALRPPAASGAPSTDAFATPPPLVCRINRPRDGCPPSPADANGTRAALRCMRVSSHRCPGASALRPRTRSHGVSRRLLFPNAQNGAL